MFLGFDKVKVVARLKAAYLVAKFTLFIRASLSGGPCERLPSCRTATVRIFKLVGRALLGEPRLSAVEVPLCPSGCGKISAIKWTEKTLKLSFV